MNSPQVLFSKRNTLAERFIAQIIQNLRGQKFYYEKEERIDAEIVPRVFEKKMPSIVDRKEYFKEETEPPVLKRQPVQKRPELKIKEKFPKQIIRIEKRPPLSPEKKIAPEIPETIPHPVISLPKFVSPVRKQKEKSAVKIQTRTPREQEKLASLLNDPSIYAIECSGAGKPLMVFRGGQKQPTKTILTEEEIKNFLKRISDSTHIPLLEGVFRAISEKISVNAVVSEFVGSKFYIKKHFFR